MKAQFSLLKKWLNHFIQIKLQLFWVRLNNLLNNNYSLMIFKKDYDKKRCHNELAKWPVMAVQTTGLLQAIYNKLRLR